jgi:hypothetical protein
MQHDSDTVDTMKRTALTAAAVVVAIATATNAGATPGTLTVDGHDYPQCSTEDCSDQPNQLGVWHDTDTDTYWLSVGEHSYRVTP